MGDQLWNESEYHPLHHDNRLQVAVRKLRKLTEDEPSRPTRLVTTADGYTEDAWTWPDLAQHGRGRQGSVEISRDR